MKGFTISSHKSTASTAAFTLCRLYAALCTAGCISQGTEIEMNRNVSHRQREGEGQQDTNCSHKQGLEMNTQILPYFHLKYQPASTVLLLLLPCCVCTCICLCMCVIMWWVGMWGNKSALSS